MASSSAFQSPRSLLTTSNLPEPIRLHERCRSLHVRFRYALKHAGASCTYARRCVARGRTSHVRYNSRAAAVSERLGLGGPRFKLQTAQALQSTSSRNGVRVAQAMPTMPHPSVSVESTQPDNARLATEREALRHLQIKIPIPPPACDGRKFGSWQACEKTKKQTSVARAPPNPAKR